MNEIGNFDVEKAMELIFVMMMHLWSSYWRELLSLKEWNS